MKFKLVHVQFFLAFLMILQPAALFAQYIEAEISITISSSTYFPSKSGFKDLTIEKTQINGRVPGQIIRSRVERYIKNPQTRITECDATAYCPVITGSSEYVVRNDTNYSIILSDLLYPLYILKTRTSNGYRFINKKTPNPEEKIVKTEYFSASGVNNIEGLSLNISAFHPPSGQIAPLVPNYVMKVSGGKYLSRIRETPVGDGEWQRWDDEKETLLPEKESLGIGIPYLMADPSHQLIDNEIYDQLLIRNYQQLDEFMLNPEGKIFNIQASGKRYLKSDYSEYEGDIVVSINLAPFGFMRKPTVELNGCSVLGVGEESAVTAKASKEGGTYRFWVVPQEILSIESNGSAATLRGASPGRGTLYVEYTSIDGKKTEASKIAACVQVESYNSGQKIPQIPLFDIDGKKLDSILNVPVETKPNNATDLLSFVPADPGVLTAVGIGNVVDIQGNRTGKTTLQATTDCGATTGPAVEVEVVNCDDETIAILERMMKAAKEGQKDAYQAIERIVGTKEFEELDSKIAESTGNLAVKTTGLIIGSLSGYKTAGAGVKTAADIYGKASNVMDILKGGDVWSQISNVSQLIVELKGSAIQQTIAGGIETFQAANEFGEDLGKMIGANQKLQSAMKEAERWNKIIIDLVNRQKLCRRGSQTQQKKQEPPTGPDTKPTEPTPTPTGPTIQTQTSPVQEPASSKETPTTTDQPSDDGTEISPPPPTSEPRKVGLPLSPSECGCDHTSSLDVSQKGFSSLQAGMENLGKCVDSFSKDPLSNYIQTLQDWQTVLNSLLNATKAKPAEFQQVSEKSIPKMESLLEQTKTFDTIGKRFIDEFGTCPKSMESGVRLMQSAKNLPEISTSNNQAEIINTK